MIPLFEFLNQHDFEFLVIGGRGLEAHGYVRNTLDLDLLVKDADLPLLGERLREYGYVRVAESPIFSRWQSPDPGTVDLDLIHVDASTFGKLGNGALGMAVGDIVVRVPSVAGMIALKLHAMRNQPDRRIRDTQDIQALLRLHPDAVGGDELLRLCERYGPRGILDALFPGSP